MDKKEIAIYAGGAVVLFLLLRWLKNRNTPTEEETAQEDYTDPYGWPVPGIAPNYGITNGGAPFQSVVNVNANWDPYSGLTREYIPMFGFVGVTAVGSF